MPSCGKPHPSNPSLADSREKPARSCAFGGRRRRTPLRLRAQNKERPEEAGVFLRGTQTTSSEEEADAARRQKPSLPKRSLRSAIDTRCAKRRRSFYKDRIRRATPESCHQSLSAWHDGERASSATRRQRREQSKTTWLTALPKNRRRHGTLAHCFFRATTESLNDGHGVKTRTPRLVREAPSQREKQLSNSPPCLVTH